MDSGRVEMGVERLHQCIRFGLLELETARLDQDERVPIDLQMHRIGTQPAITIGLLTVSHPRERSNGPVVLPGHIELAQEGGLDRPRLNRQAAGSGQQAPQGGEAVALCAVGKRVRQKQFE